MMSFRGLVNYWIDPSMDNHGGSGGSVTATSNKWWPVDNLTPGRYYVGTTSSGLSAIIIHKNNPIGRIGNLNSQLSNPKQAGFVTLPEGNNRIIIQPMVVPNTTGTISQIIIIDSDKINELKSIVDEDFPYFDYNTMPITIN